MPLLKSLAPQDGRQSDTALSVARGTRRLLRRLNFRPSPNCRSSQDGAPISSRSQPTRKIIIVEIKSSVADFRADTKWREYRAHCDRFYFAIPESVPVDIMPEDAGLILADAYGARHCAASAGASHGPGHPPRGSDALCPYGGASSPSLERSRRGYSAHAAGLTEH